jgi:threonine/homoserine/homoserine lactone efflux protein
MTIEFFLTTLVIVASPGTGVLYTPAAGLTRGARASILAAFACTLGIIPHMAAAITGLAALLHTSALAFEVIKYLGVAYLLYMAWATLKEKGALSVDTQVAPQSARKVLVEGVLINILNPKLSIFFFAFLPQFVPASAPDALPLMLELSAVFMLDFRDLRRLRRGSAPAHCQPPARLDLDAPHLRRRLCRARHQAGAHRALIACFGGCSRSSSVGAFCSAMTRTAKPTSSQRTTRPTAVPMASRRI